jgi:hypothetical protein
MTQTLSHDGSMPLRDRAVTWGLALAGWVAIAVAAASR